MTTPTPPPGYREPTEEERKGLVPQNAMVFDGTVDSVNWIKSANIGNRFAFGLKYAVPISQPIPSPGEQPTQGGDEPCQKSLACNSTVAVPSGDSGEMKAYWFCPRCDCELPGTHVTYSEHCAVCGTRVECRDDSSDSSELTRLRAEKDALLKELYAENESLRSQLAAMKQQP